MKETFDRSKPHVNIGTIEPTENHEERSGYAEVVDDNYVPNENEVDITTLLNAENPELMAKLIEAFTGPKKGFRKNKPINMLTNSEKKAKKNKRKQSRKSRRTNKNNVKN